MLAGKNIIGFIPTLDKAKARAFYEDVLGLPVQEEDAFAIVLNANGIDIRLVDVGAFTPFRFTILGWAVEDIAETVSAMRAKGVDFETYDGMEHDDLGIDGARRRSRRLVQGPRRQRPLSLTGHRLTAAVTPLCLARLIHVST